MLHEMAFIVWEENCMETVRDSKQFKKGSNNKKGQGHYLTLPLNITCRYYVLIVYLCITGDRLLAGCCILLAKTICQIEYHRDNLWQRTRPVLAAGRLYFRQSHYRIRYTLI